jgi:hypothetical protein
MHPMTNHPEKPPDPSRIVAFLAEGTNCPIGEVAKLYEDERAALAQGARVTKFVHIFAIRNVQAQLRKRADRPARKPLAVARVPAL